MDNIKNRHSGEAAVIVAAGPSLRGFVYDKCGDAVVFAVNSMSDYVDADYMTFVDMAAYRQINYLYSGLMNFSGEVFCPPDFDHMFDRELTEIKSRDWYIPVGNNGGSTPYSSSLAIWLAIEMDCSPIYLLGFDFRQADDGAHHAHPGGKHYSGRELDLMRSRTAKLINKSLVKIINVSDRPKELNQDSWKRVMALKNFDLRRAAHG